MGDWIVSSCIVILVVLALRAGLGRRISARLRYALWTVVLMRLLVPATISLAVTVPKLPAWTPPEVLREESIYVLPVDSRPVEESGVFWTEDGTAMDPYSLGYPQLTGDGERVVRYAGRISPLELAKWLWLGGGIVLGAVLTASNLRFDVRLRRSRRRLEGAGGPIPVYVSAGLPSPCLFGLLRPAVYITEMAAEDPVMLRHVTAHELTHYRHLDHLWSVLRGAALAVHWWNPLVWLAVVLSRRDGELACDEGTLRQLGDSERTAYGETLLALVTAKENPWDLLSFATTMKGSKRSLKERIRRIACQPKQLVSAVVAISLVLTLTVFCTFGRAEGDLIVPDSATGFTAFSASSHSVSPLGTLVYTPDDLHKDLSAPDDAIDVPPEAGKELVRLINTHRKNVYGQGDLTLNGIEHHFTRIDCGEDGFYLVDYWYWNGFSILHGEDSYTTLVTRFDSDGNAGTTWQMEYSFDRDYREWRTAHADIFWPEQQGAADTEPPADAAPSLRDDANYAADHPDDVSSPLGDLLAGIEAADIGDISGQDQVTAAELAALLREAERGSRFHIFDRFVEEEAWMWSTAEWQAPITGGGTLYLMACDSGNIEIGYETGEGYTSAFYDGAQELYDLITEVGEPYYLEELPYTVNLDRDRSPDKLVLRSDKPSGGAYWSLQCRLGSGERWQGEAAAAHPGWKAFFLCRLDGKDCLLEYVPYIGMGAGSYTYRLFYLEEGREVVVQENELFFDMNFGMEGERDFDPKAIAAFMDEINGLLEHSTLLLNTDPQLAKTFEQEGRLYDSLWWLEETREADKSLLENLLIYRNQALEEAAMPHAGELLADITADDIKFMAGSSGIPKTDISRALNGLSEKVTLPPEDRDAGSYPRRYFVGYTRGDSQRHTICLEAGEEEGEVYLTFEGTVTVPFYSENPENDAMYLRDVPYHIAGMVDDEELWQWVMEHGIEQS